MPEETILLNSDLRMFIKQAPQPQKQAPQLKKQTPQLKKPVNSDPILLSDIDPSKTKNYFAVLFYILLTAMQVRQDKVFFDSKDMIMNAVQQNKLNNENAAIKFSILPADADNAKINQVQTQNQEYAARREDIQNELITARQLGQQMMTRASTNVNLLEQDASEDSGWLQTINTIFQLIDEITQTG